ncbi:TerB family tellurite resistance protein [Nocardia sp. CDC159]|uniref:TerB family tellurite resistance protein n=1 Tax=Nocardia pulmonis TaxID=2951408 RepID=A0A9X2IWX8_9NOCA|nr:MULTISPECIES: TerB family tellurite resistance protein [Nocardia]MCM6773245.1 TerB family tellurite resistance protein [Nocardia pulmonis]MCM6786132.1 TerB family tellurite resistance protein [Nocardia sp. CDC159]
MSIAHRPDSSRAPEGLRDSAFRDAAVGVCALVTTAGTTGDPDRRTRIADRLGNADVLHHFPQGELRNLFEDNWLRLTLDPAFGRAYVMQQVARATDRPVQARAAVRIGLEIAGADGDVDGQGADALRECCRVLRLTPAEFGL